MSLSAHKLHKPLFVLIALQIGMLFLLTPPLFSHYTENDNTEKKHAEKEKNSSSTNQHPKKTDSAKTVETPDYVKRHLRQQPDSPIHGIDVSHYQGNIDWPSVASSHVRFAYLKATQGSDYVDPSFSHNMAHIRKTTLLVGPYHFFDPKVDTKQQLDNFLTTIKGQTLNLVPMVDVESNEQLTAQEVQKSLLKFLQQLEKRIGCQPIIYSYASFWQTDITAEFDNYSFWLADFSKTPHPPAGVKHWDIWQYSDKGQIPGIEGPVDMDVIMDGEAKLKTLSCHYSRSS